jgi:hypothetical protein
MGHTVTVTVTDNLLKHELQKSLHPSGPFPPASCPGCYAGALKTEVGVRVHIIVLETEAGPSHTLSHMPSDLIHSSADCNEYGSVYRLVTTITVIVPEIVTGPELQRKKHF